DIVYRGQLGLKAPDDIAGTDVSLVERLEINLNAAAVRCGVGAIDADERRKALDGRVVEDDLGQRLLPLGHRSERNRLARFRNPGNDGGGVDGEETLRQIHI